MFSDRFITDIVEFDKSRSKIFLDHEFAFVLYKGELRTLKLKKDQIMSEECYEEIMGAILPKRAKLRAMNLLKSRNYTEKQLRDKLKEGLYPAKIIDIAIAYVKEYGYIDDLQYAVDYIVYKSEQRSEGRIRQDLLTKGIDPDIIDRAYSEAAQNEKLKSQEDLAREVLEKKQYDPETATFEEKQKIMGFLYRKGFSMDIIRHLT